MVLISNVEPLAFLLLTSNYFDVNILVGYLWIWAYNGVCFGRRTKGKKEENACAPNVERHSLGRLT